MPRPHKDIMKPGEVIINRNPIPEGGMAHNHKSEDTWGAKRPPFPRSVLNHNKTTMRTGMALIRE